MDQNTVNAFIATRGTDFPMASLPMVKERLTFMNPEQFQYLAMQRLNSPIVAFILSFFLGGLGIDRFYVGDVLLGVLKLITCGGFGIWWLVDLFLIMGVARRKNLMMLLSIPVR